MKLPVIPTIVVTAAVAVMIGLGIWQLNRAAWKKDLLVRYAQAEGLPPISWPKLPPKPEEYYFRRASGFCLQVMSWRTVAGRNRQDQPGWAHIAQCRTGAEGPGMQVDMGWSTTPADPVWKGGRVAGVIAPDSKYALRLISASPAPGLQPSAAPSLGSIPNNHMAYAIQWFVFALTALVVYVLALRRKTKEPSPSRREGD